MATVFKRGGKRNRGGYYYVAYKDHTGRRITKCARTTDKAAAERIAAKLESDAALRRDRVIDPKTDGYRDHEARPLTDHLADLKTHLLAKGNTKKHARETHAKALCVLELAKMGHISDLSASRTQAAIAEIRDGGVSLRTCNAYLRAIKSFSRWLVRDGRAPSDPLAHLSAYNADTDPRYVRRDLSADELAHLIRAAEAGPVVKGMNGLDRAMLYRTAAGSGFRVLELRSLRPAGFDLDVEPPTVTVTAAYSKRGREDVQPIPRDLATLLRPWLAAKTDDEPVFAIPMKAAQMLRVDLAAAGIAASDDAGRVVDFHSLRHGYVSRIVEGGASVKVAQELARHSTPTLTIGRYAHTRLHDLATAVNGLPIGETSDHEAAALQATGTDDVAAKEAQRLAQRAGRESTQSRATARDDNADACENGDDRKLLTIAADSDDVQRPATRCASAPRRTRTFNRRIKSPLLCQLS